MLQLSLVAGFSGFGDPTATHPALTNRRAGCDRGLREAKRAARALGV
jgi:hypothetical protein